MKQLNSRACQHSLNFEIFIFFDIPKNIPLLRKTQTCTLIYVNYNTPISSIVPCIDKFNAFMEFVKLMSILNDVWIRSNELKMQKLP